MARRVRVNPHNNVKVIVLPMLSRNGKDVTKNLINALLRTQCNTFADICVSDTNPLLYADNAYSNTTWFGDGTHPTQAGQNLLGSYTFGAAYNWLHFASNQSGPNIVAAASSTVTTNTAYQFAYTVAAPTANGQTFTLPTCVGLPLNAAMTFDNPQSAFSGVTVKAANSAETVNGIDASVAGITIASNSKSVFRMVPGPTATGGCRWSL